MLKEEKKFAKKGAVKRLRKFYIQNRGKASAELIKILNSNPQKNKKTAKPNISEEIES